MNAKNHLWVYMCQKNYIYTLKCIIIKRKDLLAYIYKKIPGNNLPGNKTEGSVK